MTSLAFVYEGPGTVLASLGAALARAGFTLHCPDTAGHLSPEVVARRVHMLLASEADCVNAMEIVTAFERAHRQCRLSLLPEQRAREQLHVAT